MDSARPSKNKFKLPEKYAGFRFVNHPDILFAFVCIDNQEALSKRTNLLPRLGLAPKNCRFSALCQDDSRMVLFIDQSNPYRDSSDYRTQHAITIATILQECANESHVSFSDILDAISDDTEDDIDEIIDLFNNAYSADFSTHKESFNAKKAIKAAVIPNELPKPHLFCNPQYWGLRQLTDHPDFKLAFILPHKKQASNLRANLNKRLKTRQYQFVLTHKSRCSFLIDLDKKAETPIEKRFFEAVAKRSKKYKFSGDELKFVIKATEEEEKQIINAFKNIPFNVDEFVYQKRPRKEEIESDEYDSQCKIESKSGDEQKLSSSQNSSTFFSKKVTRSITKKQRIEESEATRKTEEEARKKAAEKAAFEKRWAKVLAERPEITLEANRLAGIQRDNKQPVLHLPSSSPLEDLKDEEMFSPSHTMDEMDDNKDHWPDQLPKFRAGGA